MTRGDVYWIDLEPIRGSEANKVRPCVIVSNDANNRAAATVTVVPVTSNVARIHPFEVDLGITLDRPSKAQAYQVRTVSKQRIRGEPIAALAQALAAELDEALRLHLAL